MSSTSETGHAKNVANFATLHAYILGYGETYNPSKEAITAAVLQGLVSSSQSSLELVNTALAANKLATNTRRDAFEPLSELCTRLDNAIEATDALPQTIESVKAIVRKIKGTRTSARLTDEEKATLTAEGKEAKEISSSQMSFDNRIDNFDKLIQLLISAQFAPNETELKIETLTALLSRLKASNTDVLNTQVALDNARLQRNQLLYTPDKGMIDIATSAKVYIKSVFGASSDQYKQVSKLEFRGYN